MQRFVYAPHQIDEVRHFFRQIAEAIEREERAVPGELDATPLSPALQASLESGELLALELPLPQPAIGADGDEAPVALLAEAPDALRSGSPAADTDGQAAWHADDPPAPEAEHERDEPGEAISAATASDTRADDEPATDSVREYGRVRDHDEHDDLGVTAGTPDAETMHGGIVLAGDQTADIDGTDRTAEAGPEPVPAAIVEDRVEALITPSTEPAAPTSEFADPDGTTEDAGTAQGTHADPGEAEAAVGTAFAGGFADMQVSAGGHADTDLAAEAASPWIADDVGDAAVDAGVAHFDDPLEPGHQQEPDSAAQAPSLDIDATEHESSLEAMAASADAYAYADDGFAAPEPALGVGEAADAAADAAGPALGEDAPDERATGDEPACTDDAGLTPVAEIASTTEAPDAGVSDAHLSDTEPASSGDGPQAAPGVDVATAVADGAQGSTQALSDSLRNLLVDEVRQSLAAVYAPQLEAERHRREALETSVQRLQEQRDNLELELRDASESLVVLKTEMTRMDERNRTLEADARNQQGELRSLRESRRLADAQLQELRDAVAAERARAEVAERRCEMLDISLGSSETDRLALQRDIDSLRIDLGRALEDRRASEDALNAREAELVTLRDELAALGARMEMLAAQHVELSLEAEALRQREAERLATSAQDAAARAATRVAEATPQAPAAPRRSADFLDGIDAPHPSQKARAAVTPAVSRPDPEQEKARLRVLATSFDEVAVGQYLAAVPWPGLSPEGSMSIGIAAGTGAGDRDLGAFAVAAATAQAIRRSGGSESESTL